MKRIATTAELVDEAAAISTAPEGRTFDHEPAAAFRFIDFLFPQRLLRLTDAEDNPLLVHSDRRSRRPLRRTGLALVCVLILAALYLLFIATGFRSLWQLFGPFPSGASYLAFAAGSFVLLRYHLAASDQSHHLKSLTREQLEHLLLTRLGRHELFLQPMLRFCLRYGMIALLCAVAGAMVARDILTGGYDWISLISYRSFLLVLFTFLLVWAAGVWQFIYEWRSFAGGKLPVYRHLLSLAISVSLSAAIAGFSLVGNWPAELIFAFGVLLFGGVAWSTYRSAKTLYRESSDLLWHRYLGDDVDARKYGRRAGPSILAMMLDVSARWWRIRDWWPAAKEAEPRLSWGDCVGGFLLTLLFGALAFNLFLICMSIGLDDWYLQSLPYRLLDYLPAMHCGFTVLVYAARGTRPGGKLIQKAFRAGIVSCAAWSILLPVALSAYGNGFPSRFWLMPQGMIYLLSRYLHLVSFMLVILFLASSAWNRLPRAKAAGSFLLITLIAVVLNLLPLLTLNFLRAAWNPFFLLFYYGQVFLPPLLMLYLCCILLRRRIAKGNPESPQLSDAARRHGFTACN